MVASGGFFFPPLLSCLLFGSYKVRCTSWRENFCFWITESFICLGKISCEKEDTNKWSSYTSCSPQCFAWWAGRHRDTFLLPFSCVAAFQESGALPTCLWACAEVSMPPIFERACVIHVDPI